MDFATIPATPATANTAKPPAGQRLSHQTTRLHQVSGGSSRPAEPATLIKKLTSDDCTALDCQLGAAQRTVFVLSGAPPGGSQHHFCERFQQASGGSKYSAAERVNTHTAAELRELAPDRERHALPQVALHAHAAELAPRGAGGPRVRVQPPPAEGVADEQRRLERAAHGGGHGRAAKPQARPPESPVDEDPAMELLQSHHIPYIEIRGHENPAHCAVYAVL